MTTKAIQQQIDALQARREALRKDLHAAAAQRDAARRAFVGKGEAQAKRSFVEAQAAVTLHEEAITELDQNLERLRTQLEEAQQAEARAAKMEELVRLSKEAGSARGDFEAAYKEAVEALDQIGQRLAEASTRWHASHKAFIRGLREIAPGITTVSTNRATPERLRELEAQRDVILQALEEQGADLESALSERVAWRQHFTRVYPYTLPEEFKEEIQSVLKQGYKKLERQA